MRLAQYTVSLQPHPARRGGEPMERNRASDWMAAPALLLSGTFQEALSTVDCAHASSCRLNLDRRSPDLATKTRGSACEKESTSCCSFCRTVWPGRIICAAAKRAL